MSRYVPRLSLNASTRAIPLRLTGKIAPLFPHDKPNARPKQSIQPPSLFTSKTIIPLPTLTPLGPPPPPPLAGAPTTVSASPIATSSKVKIDDFPDLPIDSSDPIAQSLHHATDKDLHKSILNAPLPPTENPTKRRQPKRQLLASWNIDWTSSIDPGLAFLELRERPTYQQFLAHIRPRFERIYRGLKASGMHQMLASDLLMLHPDPHILWTLLQVEARCRADRPLRSSTLIAIYGKTRPVIMAERLGRIDVEVCKMVIQTLMEEDEDRDLDLLKFAWEHLLRAASTDSPPWELLSIPLRFVKEGEIQQATEMMETLGGRDGLLSMRIGRINPSLPDDVKVHAILAICLRSALRLRFYDTAQDVTVQLLELVERTSLPRASFHLILDACRVAAISGQTNEVYWARETALRVSQISDAPPMPSATLNAILKASNLDNAQSFYSRLPEEHGPPSARQIVRIATRRLNRAVLQRLLQDINKLGQDDFYPQRSAFIERLLHAHHLDAVQTLYEAWSSSVIVHPHLMVGMVWRFANSSEKREFALTILEDFKADPTRSAARTLAIARAYIALQDASSAQDTLRILDPADPKVKALVSDLAARLPVEAYRLMKQARAIGWNMGASIELIAASCHKGDWSVLKPFLVHEDIEMSDEDRKFIGILDDLRNHRLPQAYNAVRTILQDGGAVPDTVLRITHRMAYGQKAWIEAVKLTMGVPVGPLRWDFSWTLQKQVLAYLRPVQGTREDSGRCAPRSVRDGADGGVDLGPETALIRTLRSYDWVELREWSLDYAGRSKNQDQPVSQQRVVDTLQEIDRLLALQPLGQTPSSNDLETKEENERTSEESNEADNDKVYARA